MTNKLYSPILIESVKAVADLSQYRFVGFDGNYCAAGAKALGVVDVSTEKGQYAPSAVFGTLLVEVGDTILAGDPVASDAEGRAVKATDSAMINGFARDAGTAKELIRIIRGI
nr:MAG TPA: capsid fiber protein [Caudoviricetes sp.]